MTRRLSRLLLAATAAAALGLPALPAGAFPDNAAARLDERLTPRFGKLLEPPLHHRPHSPRWRYGRWWTPYWRDGRWGYGYETDPAYLGQVDQYGSVSQYPGDGFYGGYGQGYPGQAYPIAPYGDPSLGGTYVDPAFAYPPAPEVIVERGRGGGFYGAEESVTADCGRNGHSDTPVADALARVRDGGTVYLRTREGACHESVEITRPVVLVGDAPGPAAGPSIAPRDGEPCIRVRPGIGPVELRDLVLDGGHGGRAACVQSWGAELTLVHVTVRYAGEGSSIYAGGGKLTLREVVIDHQSPDPAVTTEGAGLVAERVRVRSSASGFDLTSRGFGGGVRMDRVSLTSIRGPGEPRVGIIVRSGGGEGRVDLRHLRICEFRTGVWLEPGFKADISTAHILGAQLGVVADGGDLTLTDSLVGGHEVAVYVPSGRAHILHNRLFDFTGAPIDGEWRSEVFAAENWIYPERGCGLFSALFDHWCRRRNEFQDHYRRATGWGDEFGFEGLAFDYPSGWRAEEPRRMEFGRHSGAIDLYAPGPAGRRPDGFR